jgi:hypothetical protein
MEAVVTARAVAMKTLATFKQIQDHYRRRCHAYYSKKTCSKQRPEEHSEGPQEKNQIIV